jgi:hypothetical protein
MAMTTNDEATDRDEIEMLLPWHAAGTLSRDDAARVEAALKRDDDLARRYRLVCEERDETVTVNEQLGVPAADGTERLMAKIEKDRGRARRAAGFDLVGGLAGLLSRIAPRTLAWSAAAAVLVVIVQAALLAGIYLGRLGPATYQTASFGDASPQTPATSVFVRFDPSASAAEIARVLRENKASITDGPRAGGLYRIRVGDKGLPREELAAIMARMQQEKGVIRLVVPAE